MLIYSPLLHLPLLKMKYLILAVFLVTISSGFGHTIRKRNLYNFQTMIKMVTNRSPWDYNNYGNWCGRGGKNEPVDDVDSCCRDHDLCYYTLNRAECKNWMKLGVYVVTYNWSFENGVVTCSTDQSDCAQVLCRCDKTAVECFARSEYNEENKRGWFA